MGEDATSAAAGGGARGRDGAPKRRDGRGPGGPLFGALDLGTNNCRLLVAARTRDGFRVVDAFSRIVRLGEGLDESGALSVAAMDRAVEALKVCAAKMRRRGVERSRCVATQACRGAANGPEFLHRVKHETGLSLDMIAPSEEARLAVMGCLNLIDRNAKAALVIDIGGGSTELSWIDIEQLKSRERAGRPFKPPIVGWMSMPVGVVTLAERFPEHEDRCAWYDAMKAHVRERLFEPDGARALRPFFEAGEGHLIGTSGTVTSLAGVHLGLDRYDRSKVDGLWVKTEEALEASRKLQAMCKDERAAEPCIGPERADLVLAGCALLEAVTDVWPSRRLRVADRGLREGLLMTLMHAPKRRRGGGRRRRKTGRKAAE